MRDSSRVDSGRAHLLGGKYRLEERVGAGGMAQVWRARNEATAADVAVKLSTANDDGARFRHEARVGAMLSHRSIVRIFDLVEEGDGRLLLVMELLRGETLGERLARRGPMPTSEALAVVVAVLSALDHAHAAGVVHRDLTPSNIFLATEPDGCVLPKLLDFGIAKLPSGGALTLDGQILGTPRYMAPERIRERGPIDGRSDLFSVGVILYEALTGTSPFAATSASASLASVLETVVDPDPLIEPPLWPELQRAMAKQPYERHRSAREMADRLLAAAGHTEAGLSHVLRAAPPAGRALSAAAPAAPPPSHSSNGPGSTAVWLVALAAALGVAAVTATVVHRRDESSAAEAVTADHAIDSPNPNAASARRVPDDLPPTAFAVGPSEDLAPTMATAHRSSTPPATAPFASASSPTDASSSRSRAKPPGQPRRSTGIGTTPGF